MTDKHKENARVFKALSDEKRLGVLELLRQGEQCACDLLERMHIGQSGLSYHMKILVDSGIVESRHDGKWTYYQISEPGSKKAMALLGELTMPEEDPNVCRIFRGV